MMLMVYCLPGSSVPTVCRYWDVASSSWSTRGVVTVGSAVVGSQQYLQCAASHLTAFLGSLSPAGLEFEVNVVHPIDDAGSLQVLMGFRLGLFRREVT